MSEKDVTKATPYWRRKKNQNDEESKSSSQFSIFSILITHVDENILRTVGAGA